MPESDQLDMTAKNILFAEVGLLQGRNMEKNHQ